MFNIFEKKKSQPATFLTYKGEMKQGAGVDIMFIAKNNKIIYTNNESDHLFFCDSDGDKKLDGRVVNMVFTGQSDKSITEVFVMFDDPESYMLFTQGVGRDVRFNYIAQEIFKYFSGSAVECLFTHTQGYATQYIYVFKLYKNGDKYFMLNNSHSLAYLIFNDTIKRGSGDEIKPMFWG